MPRLLTLALVAGLALACGQPAPEEPPVVTLPPGEQPSRPPATTPSTDVPTQEPPAVTPPGEAPPPEAPAPRWPDVQTELPHYTLRIAPRDYAQLVEHLKHEELRVPGTFVAEGQEYPVEVRLRGRSTRFRAKKSFQVRFNQGVQYRGLKRLELLASWRDAGHLTEKLWYDLAQAMGMRAPRATHVLLDVVTSEEASFEGAVYLQLESVTKDFLEAHGFDDDSDIYRCGMHDCELTDRPRSSFMEPWEKRTNEAAPWDNLHAFLEQVNRTPPGEFRRFAERALELEDYLRWMALQEAAAIILHQDSRSFLVQDASTRRWTYVPWDLNNAMSVYVRGHVNGPRQGYLSRAQHPILNFTAYDAQSYDDFEYRRAFAPDMHPQWSVLSTRILDDEALRARYVEVLEGLLETHFRPDVICPRLEATAALLRPHQLREARLVGEAHDPHTGAPVGTATFVDPAFLAPVSSSNPTPKTVWWLCQYVTERRKFLRSQLERIRDHGRTALKIDQVGRDAQGRFFVEVHNGGTSTVDLSGHTLTGNPRFPTRWRLPAVALRPGERWRFTEGAAGGARLGTALEAARPEVGLFAADGRTAVDLLFLPPLAPGAGYRRSPSGSETLVPLP